MRLAMSRIARAIVIAAIASVLLFTARARAATPTATPTAMPTAHTVNFINNCSQPIWIAANGNVDLTPPVSQISSWELAPKCGTNFTCPAGSTCLDGACSCTQTNQSDPLCNGGLCLPSGVCATSVAAAIPLTYSGRVWGRTGCNSNAMSCVTGDCGATDCFGAGANNATLWEATLAGTNAGSFPGTLDNYDVSLVSGYNVPINVSAEGPTDAPGWNAGATYTNGQAGSPQSVIVAPAGTNTWLFNDVGPSPTATSGATVPPFSTVLRGTADDPNTAGAGIVWSTTSSTCQTGSCTTDLLRTCPPLLRVDNSSQSCTANNQNDPNCAGGPCDSNGTCVIACTVPVNYCALNPSATICTAQNNSFYACLNQTSTEVDPFGHQINLESANSGNAVCFSSADCQPGTTCLMTPTFTPASNVTWPAGAGLCIPGNGAITQNGGCTSSAMDGQACPSANFTFPFPAYTCATLTNASSAGAQASTCLPPINNQAVTGPAAFGALVWNADNFTPINPSQSCTADSDCGTGNYCLEAAVRKFPTTGTVMAQAVNECAGASDTCVCNSVNNCTSSATCTGNTQCQDSVGKACGASETCICQTPAVYTGVCGPTNVNWTAAINQISVGGNNYLSIFKSSCPTAYSFQFDDQASDWTCNSTSDQVVNYNVTFCGVGGKGAQAQVIAEPTLR